MHNRVFIIGCGPSLTGFDFNCLNMMTTIATNYAAFNIPYPTYFITADSGVIRKTAVCNFQNLPNCHFKSLPKCTSKIAVIGPTHKGYKKVTALLSKFDKVITPNRSDGHIGFDWPSFATGKNTGFVALQFAVLLGFEEIYLLGIDLDAKNNQKYFYEGQRKKKTIIPSIFFECFRIGLQRLKRESNVKVVSCSKTSLLNKFISYEPIEKVLAI